jgi:hypothetical protein
MESKLVCDERVSGVKKASKKKRRTDSEDRN